MVSRGRLSCIRRPLECVQVASSLSTWDVHMWPSPESLSWASTQALLELDGSSADHRRRDRGLPARPRGRARRPRRRRHSREPRPQAGADRRRDPDLRRDHWLWRQRPPPGRRPTRRASSQQNMIRFMGCGTGPIAPPEVARVTMLLRANCLAKGNSGRPAWSWCESLLDLLNHDVLPLIPERGSCGASGDLVPLSYVGRALIGDGERRRSHGEPRQRRRRAGRARARAGRARGQGGARADQRDLVHERVCLLGGRRRS